MKVRKLLLTTTLSFSVTSAAFAQDATTTQSTAVNRNVTVSGNIETVTPNAPNYDDGVFLGGGTYIDTVASSTTATSLNTSGNSATSIGNSTGQTTITGSSVTVNGAADLNNGLNVDGQTTLDATTIVGVTSITGATSINTTGTASTTIGNSSAGTEVFISGGSSSGDTVAVSSGGIRAFESQIDFFGEGDITNEVNIRAKLIAGLDAEQADITLDADDDVNIRTGDDLEVVAQSKVQLDAVDNIELDTGNNVEVLAANDIDMTATRILGTTGNATSVMQNGSIVNTVTASDGVSAGTVVANNGSARWVADANGKLTEVTNADTTSGTTASMVVQNSAGNIHGLVVQETKTTLSGGINSASLTLDDRGATFSDPANGNPIQVHGVADGTAPFDAVNVRQLYSGLASVLAAAPDIRLEPGKTGFGIGVGSYGGYQAVGLGFGHMYDNGVVLTGSVARGAHSETAARASLSWTW